MERAQLLQWHLLFLSTLVLIGSGLQTSAADSSVTRLKPYPKSELDLKSLPFKIVYESYLETDGQQNWELVLVNADGSNPTNLTQTADVSEMYPHASPDGKKICFVADEGTGRDKVRNVYFMNIDGTGRTKVADNARQPCWGPDSRTIAYLKAEFKRYTIRDYATKELIFYNTETGKHTPHVNTKLHHLYNICWSPDGKWFVATVHGGMGFDHAVLTFEADGTAVRNFWDDGVGGCRPDLNPAGTMITWGMTDWDLYVADIDLTAPVPKVSNRQATVKCDKEHEVYHTDFSPDGRYIAFSYGPKAQEQVGGEAPGWNICVSDLNGKWVQITTDGHQNKEPDWVPMQ